MGTPVTGVIVRAESFRSGLGCGTDATEMATYAVFVRDAARADGIVVAAGVYPCFSDATFVRLRSEDDPTSTAGRFAFDVIAFNALAASHPDNAAVLGDIPNRALLRTTDEGNVDDLRAALRERSERLQAARAALKPTWVTRCEAQQRGDIQVLADCTIQKLTVASGAAQVVLQTKSLVRGESARPDAGTIDSGGPDAAGDADAGDANASETGAGDAATIDATTAEGGAGAPEKALTCADYTRARVQYRAGRTTGAQDVLCEQSWVVDPAIAPAAYTFVIELQSPGGAILGKATCRASTSPGLVTEAACSAVE